MFCCLRLLKEKIPDEPRVSSFVFHIFIHNKMLHSQLGNFSARKQKLS